jgi:hypothetical protein
MKRTLWILILYSVTALVFTPLVLAKEWFITEIPVFPLWGNDAGSINRWGDVAVSAAQPLHGDYLTYLWREDTGSLHQVGPGEQDGGFPQSLTKAVDLNDNNFILGFYNPNVLESASTTSYEWYQTYLPVEKITVDNYIHVGAPNSEPVAINNANDWLLNYPGSSGTKVALSGFIVNLDSSADVNNKGVILGSRNGQTKLYYGGSTKNVDGIDTPVAINDSGTVLGIHNGKAAIWQDGKGVTDIGAFTPLALSGNGTVVGKTFGAVKQTEAVIWDPAHGLRNLNDLLSADDFAKYHLNELIDINQNSRIVALGTRNDQSNDFYNQHLFVISTPEPVSMFLFCTGGAVLALFRRKKLIRF